MTQTNTAMQNLLNMDRQVTDCQSLAAGAGAVWLFGSGLIGLASFTRRKNKSTILITA
jgi:hypothetical protein